MPSGSNDFNDVFFVVAVMLLLTLFARCLRPEPRANKVGSPARIVLV